MICIQDELHVHVTQSEEEPFTLTSDYKQLYISRQFRIGFATFST